MTDPYYQDERVTLWHGDCLDVLPTLPDASMDSVVTDPPYELGFMGKGWDATGIAYNVTVWRECLRVLKPGGHLLAFGGTRTWHRLAVAIEDAGFELRDSIAWLYGSGFPKSLDVSKAIDKAAGAEREVVAQGTPVRRMIPGADQHRTGSWIKDNGREFIPTETAPATPDAERWQGWGTALKPSHEPVCVAVKPHATGDILAEIGSHLDRLEAACRPSANGAARSSAPTRVASREVRTATAPESAATLREGEHVRTTPTGAAAGSSAQTGTSASESTGETCWSTVTSWRACWDELCELTSTYTTSTATRPTTDLRTLWSSIASLMVTSTPDSPTPRLTELSTATAVDSLFAATVLSWRAILALSATESATASTPPRRRGAGGSSTAFEPVVVARKPLVGTVASNVLAWGTGALNIDATRIESGDEMLGRVNGARPPEHNCPDSSPNARMLGRMQQEPSFIDNSTGKGRWPANVVLDEHAAAELDRQSGESSSRIGKPRGASSGDGWGMTATGAEYNDQGGASRFFFIAREDNEPCPSTSAASTAATPSPHPSEPDGSAPSDAATSASLDIERPTGSPSTSGTPSGSRPSDATSTPTTTSTASESSRDWQPEKPPRMVSPARYAAHLTQTDTTTTTTSPSASGGSAGRTTSSTTPTSVPGVPLDALGSRFTYVAKAPASERPRVGGIAHPTVKPLDLMRWLVRLVTPPGGTVLEPFAGSGTTGEAAALEGFDCILIEREADYLPLIVSRLDKPVQLGLNFEEPS